MKTVLLFAVACLAVMTACAQDKNKSLAVGIDVAVPVYTAVGDMRGTMTGIFIKREWRWGKWVAGTVSAGYNRFVGSIDHFSGDKLNDFATVPLLAGLKCYAWNKYYASLEAGVSVKAHKNAATKFTLAPAVGMLLPVAGRHIDLGIRFYTIPMGASYPEAPLLNRGGYSFLGARLALVF